MENWNYKFIIQPYNNIFTTNMKKSGLFFIIFFAAFLTVKAQNNNSPYSIIGLGDIETSYFDRASGMANSGISLSSNRFMYNANPASFANLENHFFQLEFSSRFKYDQYSGNISGTSGQNSYYSSDLQPKKFALAIKVKKFWVASVGLLPFSTSNFSFYANKNILGTILTNPAYYQGQGGINQIYFTNCFILNKNLSVGVQSGFLFGHTQQEETVYPSSYVDSTLTTTKNIYYTNPYFKFGLQYRKKLSSKLQIGLGATGSLQTKIRSTTTLLVTDGNTTIYNNDNYTSNYYYLPYMYSGGLSVILKDKYTFSTDYNFQAWGTQNYAGVGSALTNSTRYSAGFEYSNKTHFRDYTYEKYFLQAGAFINNSYVILNGQQIKDFGGTVGAGYNSLRGLTILGALEVGNRGTTTNGLIRENYIQATVTFSYRDFWFTKVKRYD